MENYVNYTLLKNTRNLILAETDKYLLPDYPITSEQLEIVKNYRKSLRDFTNNNYIMPDKPDFVITLN
jgi:predicted ATP-dependent Lon-type protease